MIILYIYIMLHAKFHHNRTIEFCRRRFLKIFTIYGHSGHLDHVTSTIYINCLFPLLKEAPPKVWLWLAMQL